MILNFDSKLVSNSSFSEQLNCVTSSPSLCNLGEDTNHAYINTATMYNNIANDFRSFNLAISSQIFSEIEIMLKFCSSKGLILDAGCGSGVYTSYMASRGFNVRGVDFSSGQIALAQSFCKNQKIDWRCENLVSFKVNKEEYDGILINSCFHHILFKDQYRFLKKMCFSLRNTGRILFITKIHPFTHQLRIEGNVFNKHSIRFSLRRTEEDILKLIYDSGLKVEFVLHKEQHHSDKQCFFHHMILSKKFTNCIP
ncbi:MAG: class I SAM-dependent methyltransferase [Bacteroidales bacterium]|jgi:2-polyprenyl-3-methyl-5-hydroxy-6-metoxy-1,4-benzoquinol methylase|nr:class I SAM-dependent methyltransferase [Bacteroidales bacterium]